MNGALKSTVLGAGSDDLEAYRNSETTFITSTIPEVVGKLSQKFKAAKTFV